jgi:hypothetical protein
VYITFCGVWAKGISDPPIKFINIHYEMNNHHFENNHSIQTNGTYHTDFGIPEELTGGVPHNLSSFYQIYQPMEKNLSKNIQPKSEQLMEVLQTLYYR